MMMKAYLNYKGDVVSIKELTLSKEKEFLKYLDQYKKENGFLIPSDINKLSKKLGKCLYCKKYYIESKNYNERCTKCLLSGKIKSPQHCMDGLALERFEVIRYDFIIYRTKKIIHYINKKG